MQARIILVGIALLATALSFVPTAAAECEPSPLDPDYCPGTIGPTVNNLRNRVDDLVERIDPILTLECEWDENGNIRCE